MIARFFQYKFLRPVWLFLRVWLGIQWFNAGYHKLTDPSEVWVGSKAGTAIRGFWLKVAGVNEALQPAAEPLTSYEWYKNFILSLLRANREKTFSYIIVYGEIIAGAALVLGALTVVAALGAAFMNFNYLLAGTASINGPMYTAALLLILAGINAGYYGVDYFLLMLYRKFRGESMYPRSRL